jgi:CBS-domain-containing membrane protein
MPAGIALCQRLQQGLGLLQVSRVKALGEPAVDRRQQLVGISTLALLLPEATEAHGGPQFQRFRLPAAGESARPGPPR